MTIAYLVNHYPTVSHSFIRREILGIEAAGGTVRRFSIRPPARDLPDAQDRAEVARTEVVLADGMGALIGAGLRTMLTRPGRFARALRAAISMGQGRPSQIARQLIYLLEACWIVGRLAGVSHLHAHFGTNPAAVARLVHLLSGVSYSFTVHGPEEFDGPRMLDLPGKIADARFVVAISSFGRSQLMRWTDPAAWDKLAVIRCGVDEMFAGAETAPPVERPELSCVARLSGQKGLPILIEAAALVKQRGIDFHLTLVGDGEMRREIEAMIAQRGLTENVTITGYLDAAGVRNAITQSRAMVLPSFAEGLPVVIMEALALSTPVIVTAIAGTPELVDASCGWLIPAGSVEPLADAMAEALAASPERLREMGAIGRARVLEQHDAGRNARQIATLMGAL
ncbi:glycosyltransferase family 4 protein [Sphingomonas sp. MMS24-J13]|uniref:glycosyltransferase family 4 protein n=1 Tax=Sphingomonas sp. MMS24-J13 TaxID=3238686 RepID=UPI00384F4E9C